MASNRAKKLETISRKIANFIVEETFTDEPNIQHVLAEAIAKLDQARWLMVESDKAAVTHG